MQQIYQIWHLTWSNSLQKHASIFNRWQLILLLSLKAHDLESDYGKSLFLNSVPERFVMEWFWDLVRNRRRSRHCIIAPSRYRNIAHITNRRSFMLAIFLLAHSCDMQSCDQGYHKLENLEVFPIGITLLRCDRSLNMGILHRPGLYPNRGVFLSFYDVNLKMFLIINLGFKIFKRSS